MELEDGRTPLAAALDASLEEAAVAGARLWRSALRCFLLGDFVLTPVFFLASFSLDFAKCFQSEVLQWSSASSIVDWVLVSMARDIVMLFLISRCCRNQASASRPPLRWVRRIAVIVTMVGTCRCTELDFSDSHVVAFNVPTVAVSGLMATTIALVAHMLLKSRERSEKLREAAQAANASREDGGAAHPEDAQYKSELSFFLTLKVMKPYFWPCEGERIEVLLNRTRAVSTWVCVVGSKGCTLVAPMCLAAATNGAADALQDGFRTVPTEVMWTLSLYAFLMFMNKALKECQALVYMKVQQAAYIEIADTTFDHLHSLSLDWHLRKKMGNVVRGMDRGIQAAQQTMQYVFLYLLPTIMEAIAITLIFMFKFKNPRLAVFVGMNLYLYIYVTVKTTLWRKQFRTKTTMHDNDLHDRLTDSLMNYETVKYFTAENYERSRYREATRKFQKYSMATQASLSLLNTVQALIVHFSLAGGMLIATASMLRDGREVGEFVAVNAYILNIYQPLSFLGTIYNMVINALVDMHSFGQMLAEKPDVVDQASARSLDLTERPATPMVEFRNVSFAYKRQPLARSIKDVSFKTIRGGSSALVGATGAGKTTITRLLFRFYDTVSGQVLVNGQDVRSVTQRSLRAAIGLVPQDVVMFNDTISHNVRYGNIDSATQEHVRSAARKAQLDDFINQQASGYETMVGERGLKLSGGEKQRMAIARCLVKDPPIVVLDEATSALDTHTEQKVQEALDVLSDARTVIAIAHRLSTVRNFDAILVLGNGEVVERGTHVDLLARSGSRYASMWNRQATASTEAKTASEEVHAGGGGLAMTDAKRCPVTGKELQEGQVSECPALMAMGMGMSSSNEHDL